MKQFRLLILCWLVCFQISLIQPAESKELLGEIKVLSLNTFGLPAPIGLDLDQRIPRIAKAIQDFDIVLLQETFDNRYDNFAQTTGYPHWVHHNTDAMFQLRSGLMTLSKYPIIKSEFRPFKSCAFPDCLAVKGILFTRIMHPTLGQVDVYNTHFQSRQAERAATVRIQAGNQLMRNFILSNNQYFPTILGGDFNAVLGQPEYQDLLEKLDLFEPHLSHPEGHEKGTIAPYGRDEKRYSKRIIDYIFVLKNTLMEIEIPEFQVVFQDKIDGFHLSDHFGVVSRIRFHRAKP